MVRLTMTPAILRALEYLEESGQVSRVRGAASEPSLDQPAVGNPITHGQIIAISKTLRENKTDANDEKPETMSSYHLDDLLRGSKVYIDPPKPKAEPVGSTYLQLHHRSH